MSRYSIKLQDSDTIHIDAHEWRYIKIADTEWIVFFDQSEDQVAGIPHDQIVTLVRDFEGDDLNGSE